jgi:hypothetical protein
MRANPVTPPKQLLVRLRLNQPGRARRVRQRGLAVVDRAALVEVRARVDHTSIRESSWLETAKTLPHRHRYLRLVHSLGRKLAPSVNAGAKEGLGPAVLVPRVSVTRQPPGMEKELDRSARHPSGRPRTTSQNTTSKPRRYSSDAPSTSSRRS